jgi:hypothetical protein
MNRTADRWATDIAHAAHVLDSGASAWTYVEAEELGESTWNELRKEAVRRDMAIVDTGDGYALQVRCACGACNRRVPFDETMLLEFMPVQHRDAYTQASNRGTYPANGAERLRVALDCGQAIVSTADGWTHEVTS